MSEKIEYCIHPGNSRGKIRGADNCLIVPINKTNESTSLQYSGYIRRNKFKTVYQGQPSNITIVDIHSDRAHVRFEKIGKPIYYEIRLVDHKGAIFTYKTYTNELKLNSLEPDTTYEVSVVAYYTSGDVFQVNRNATFKTLDKWKISGFQYFYPQDQTYYPDSSFSQIPIRISFIDPARKPEQYRIQIFETNVDMTFDTKYLDFSQYRFPIRNDQNNTIQITSIYNDPTSTDNTYDYHDIIIPFEEGPLKSYQVLVYANYIDIRYALVPGLPTYTFYLYDSSGTVLLKNVYNAALDPNPGSLHDVRTTRFDHLEKNTSYKIRAEIFYATSNNTYIRPESEIYTTLDKLAVSEIQYIATGSSLTFSWNPPNSDFTNHTLYPNASYFIRFQSISSLQNSIDISQSFPANLTDISFHYLDFNTDYKLTIESKYELNFDESYIFERIYKTLYEGDVSNIMVSNITGTSVDLSYEPFTVNGHDPSTPDYYRIQYRNQSTNISGYYNTYLTNDTLYNVLELNTTYTIFITAVYYTGNTYTHTLPIQFTTKNEGAVETIRIVETYGNRVDLEWDFFASVAYPNELYVHTFIGDICMNSYQIPYDSTNTIVDLSYNVNSYNTEHRFSIESIYGGNRYEKSIFETTRNEYSVKLGTVVSTSNSIEIRKSSDNNQDTYEFIRTDFDTFEWVQRPFVKSSIEEPTTSLIPYSFEYVHMTKSGSHILFCPSLKIIEIFERTLDSVTNESSYVKADSKTITIHIPLFSIQTTPNASTIVIAHQSPIISIYTQFQLTPQIITLNTLANFPSKFEPRYISLSTNGHICALAHNYIYSEDLSKNGFYVLDISNPSSPQDFFITYPFLHNIENFYTQFIEHSLSLNRDGSLLAVAYSLHTQNINHPEIIQNNVLVYEKNINGFQYSSVWPYSSNAINGSRVSLNPNGNKLLITNNYDISNSLPLGSVQLYDISGTNFISTHTFWGSINNALESSFYRNTSMNDIGTVVAIGEYTFSYDSKQGHQGQVYIYDLSGTWTQRGNTLRQYDIIPTINDDTILPGDWYGFFLELNSIGTEVLTASRPKLGRLSNKMEGDVFVHKWQNPLFRFKVPNENWPIIVENLQPATNYRFTIRSTYEHDIRYVYIRTFDKETLSNQKPEPIFDVFNTKIRMKWNAVPIQINEVVYYTIRAIVNTEIYETTILETFYTGSPPQNEFIFGINNITIEPGSLVNIYLSSNYTTLIDEEPVLFEYIGFNDSIQCLNENFVSNESLILLNRPELVVLNIQPPGYQDISLNIVRISNVDISNDFYTFDLLNDHILIDLSNLMPNYTYQCDISSIYNVVPDTNVLFYQSQTYFSSTTFTVSSKDDFPTTYITNGRFYGDYETILKNVGRSRSNVSRSRGLFLTFPSNIPQWESSRSVYIAENIAPNNALDTTKKYLSLNDTSLNHILLYRTNDLTPGISQEPGFLCQPLANPLYTQNYTIRFFIANHDIYPSIYSKNPTHLFSETISYKIELYTDLNGMIYDTSTIRNDDNRWNQMEVNLNIDSSQKNVYFKIRRLENEYNNLYLSDISFSIIPSLNLFDTTPIWDSSWNKNVWNGLSTSANGKWQDVWSYNTILNLYKMRLSGNLSVSCWFYMHRNDYNGSIFFIENTFSIDMSGTQISFIHTLENGVKTNISDATITNINTAIPHFLTFTISNHIIHTYLNGTEIGSGFRTTIPFQEALRENLIQIGDQTTNDISGISLKYSQLFDHALPYESIQTLYNETKNSELFDSFGNSFDLRDLIVYENITNNVQTVQYQLHGFPTIFTKQVFVSNVSGGNLNTHFNVSGLPCTMSLWLLPNFTFLFGMAGGLQSINLKTDKTDNHISLIINTDSVRLFLNGFYYDTYYGVFDTTMFLEFFNTADIKIYNRALSEIELRTAYFDAFQLYTTYDLSGIYDISFVKPNNFLEDLSYSITNIPSFLITDISANDTFPTNGNLTIRMNPFDLNDFHRNHYTMNIEIPKYKITTPIDGSGNPYIGHNVYDQTQYVYEGTPLHFTIENYPNSQGSSYNYEISGNVSASDLSGINGITGDISTNIITIHLKEDHKIETRNGYETLEFHIADLHLATSIRVYERYFFLIYDLSMTPNYHPITANFNTSSAGFKIQLFSQDISSGLQYHISGVQETQDISASVLSGTFPDLLINHTTGYYESEIFTYIVNADPDGLGDSKYNIPFEISLDHPSLGVDLSYVKTGILINDFYNIQSDVASVQEGDSFTITFKVPIYVPDGIIFHYQITGSAGFTYNDISGLSSISDLSGNFTVQNNKSTKTFYVAKDQYKDDNETFIISVYIDENALNVVSDTPVQKTVSTSVLLKNLLPTFELSAKKELSDTENLDNVNENESFYVILKTDNIPDYTDISYTITGIEPEDISGGQLQGSFHVINSSANVQFFINADRTTEGGQHFLLSITDYINDISGLQIYINDTSTYPRYDLSVNKTVINEGDTFTVMLFTENAAPVGHVSGYEIPYEIGGNINIADILYISSLTGTFVLDANGYADKTFEVRPDSSTEGPETIRFSLTGNAEALSGTSNLSFSLSDIYVDILINDTSLGPEYNLTIQNAFQTTTTFNNGDTLVLGLATENVNRGSRIGFILDTNSYEIFDSDRLIYSNGKYYGMFIAGIVETINIQIAYSIGSSGSSIQVPFSLSNNNPFLYNGNRQIQQNITFNNVM